MQSDFRETLLLTRRTLIIGCYMRENTVVWNVWNIVYSVCLYKSTFSLRVCSLIIIIIIICLSVSLAVGGKCLDLVRCRGLHKNTCEHDA